MGRRRYVSAYSDTLMRAVADKVRRGLSVDDAIECYGISADAIEDAMTHYGMAHGEYYESLATHDRCPADTVDMMRDMRALGMRCSEIADACGVSRITAIRYTRDVY